MTSRELVIKVLNHQPTPRTPRDIWLPPVLETARPDDLAEMAVRYSSDVLWIEPKPAVNKRSSAKPPREGTVVDAWGCVWAVTKSGEWEETKDVPLSEHGKLAAYEPPSEVLDAARFAKVGKAIDGQSRFALGRSDVRPFERLQALRGAKHALMDLARDTKDIRKLLGEIHEINCRELKLWAATEVDGVAFRDVWGSDESLFVAPAMWREIFKPLYREYCQILHDKDKFAFFITGGNVADIMSDLVKIEVDAVHSRWAAMNLDRMAKRFRGQITFWGGLDRPETLAAGKPDEVRQSVQRVRQALDYGAGGMIAQCRWEPETPLCRARGLLRAMARARADASCGGVVGKRRRSECIKQEANRGSREE